MRFSHLILSTSVLSYTCFLESCPTWTVCIQVLDLSSALRGGDSGLRLTNIHVCWTLGRCVAFSLGQVELWRSTGFPTLLEPSYLLPQIIVNLLTYLYGWGSEVPHLWRAGMWHLTLQQRTKHLSSEVLTAHLSSWLKNLYSDSGLWG